MTPSNQALYAEVLLPLAVESSYTYRIPGFLSGSVQVGRRVEVQFGARKRYAGIVARITDQEPSHRTKEIISVLDDYPIVRQWQLDFWGWIASYYCCTPGEVMKAALPGALQLSSETIITPLNNKEDDILQLESPMYELMRIIQTKDSITLEELEKTSGLSVLYPHIIRLYQLGMIVVAEALEEKYVPKKVRLIRLTEDFAAEQTLNELADVLSKNEKQLNLLLAYLAIGGYNRKPVEPKQLLEKAEVSAAVLKTMIQKGIMEEIHIEVNRMDRFKEISDPAILQLSEHQSAAYKSIKTQWDNKDVVLLQGVTGSGKTIIYQQLIRDIIEQGGQVLYLVPEIGLSVQVLNRLKHQFGNKITVSHSRLTDNERVDLWNQVQQGIPVVAGVRSSIFLPFQNLQLIIVDEEHDTSYKQQEPNPRYHARDTAIYLSQLLQAKVLLGSATPSIDSYFQCDIGKYGKAMLTERYMGMELPEIIMIDKRKDKSAEGSPYSHSLIEEIRLTLENKKQVIIFKNRRGYAPVLKCDVCQWVAECPNCDLTLTYHKGRNKLVCHVCGTSKPLLELCPACGSPHLKMEGYGTEKIEDELNEIFPDAVIRRMDLDTTRGKNNMENIIYDFEHQKIDILVGTQMVTKGLDFDHVGLVGVIYADQALYYPDFRAAERTFQTLVQVSGRAGRKNDQGKVMIQTYQPEHAVFEDVVRNDYNSFYDREIHERELFKYPPLVRQIAIIVKHKQAEISREAAELFVLELKAKYGNRVLGPSVPSVSRLRGQYINLIYIKMEKNIRLIQDVKNSIREFQHSIVRKKSLSTVRINVDVDPYH